MTRSTSPSTRTHVHTDNGLATTKRPRAHRQAARDYFYERYHVNLGHKRTTISVDKTLSILMSLHLNTQPNTHSAHLAVRAWLQARLDENNDPGRIRVSQWLQGRLAEALVGPALKQKYDAWRDSELDKTLSSSTDQLDGTRALTVRNQ
jgi:hypothetical protein